jgi:LPXTG-motif cell wall-anchored protein/uncharacterized repeat protein (TIGR02543 family)
MKKAKSLLAILLALTLVLALAPTAWAAAGHAVTITPGEGIEVTGGTASGSQTDGSAVTVTYKVKDSYETPKYKVEIAGNADYSQAAPSEADGVYTLTVPDADITGDVTITLSATKTAKKVNVIFSAGDGVTATGMPDPLTQSKKAGDTYSLPDGKPARDGYTFTGWKASTGDTYQAGASYGALPETDVTFTAQWAQNFTITYTNGGNAGVTNLPAKQEATSGEKVTLGDAPKLDGFAFVSWKDEDGKTYAAKQQIEVTKSLILTPVWGESVTVTYMENNASAGTENKVVGDKITLKQPGSTPADKIFTGWKCSADDKVYAAGAEYTLGKGNVVFTAQYGVKVTIKYALNAADATSAVPGDETLSGGTTFKAPAAPTRTDTAYKFRGWKASWDNKVYAAGATVTAPATAGADYTLTAQWAKTATISFASGTTTSVGNMPASLEADQGGSFTAPAAPTRNDSYSFTGWKASWNNVKYQAGANVPVPSDLTTGTMTAQWEKKYYPDHNGDHNNDGGGTVNTYYSIDASCSSGGYISPDGRTSVRRGNNLTVTWGPKNGYVIDGVYIDGVLNNRYDGSYTFRDVDESHTIYVRYVRDYGSSSGGSSGGGSDTSPKTGDQGTPIALLLGLSGIALATLLYARKRARS